MRGVKGHPYGRHALVQAYDVLDAEDGPFMTPFVLPGELGGIEGRMRSLLSFSLVLVD